VRKFPLQAVRGLARPATANRIRHDNEVLCRVERLPGGKQLVGEARTQPICAGAGIALQKQHAINDLSRGIALCRAKSVVVELQLG
jgi:hypothetical protein